MPFGEPEIEKVYYSMGEVTKMFEVNASQIRFYEREFNVLQPKKTKKGNRLFRREDIDNLKIIFSLKNEGYTLQGIREYIKNNKKELQNTQSVINSLEKLKAFLIDVRESL